MVKHDSANYSPEIPKFPTVNPFLPCYGKFDLTTYIQGASDYEIMTNLVQLYNTVAKGYNDVQKLSTDTVSAFNQLQTFVNTFFDNLDVQQEINNKLNAMKDDGSLSVLLNKALSNSVQNATYNWLRENVTPVGSMVAVDASLSISGAGADAKITGNRLDELGNSKASNGYVASIDKRVEELENGGLKLKDTVITDSINTWLTTHPEATTTVQDSSITIPKLSDDFYNHAFQTTSNSFNIKANTIIYNTQVILSVAIKQGEKYKIKVSDNNDSLSVMHLYECNTDNKTDLGIISAGVEYEKTATKDITYFAIWTSVAPNSDATGTAELKYDYTSISIVNKVEMLEKNFNSLNANIYSNNASEAITTALTLYKSVTLTPGKIYNIKTPITLSADQRLNANGAILLNETGEYCIYMINKVGSTCLITGATIINGYGIQVQGPNATVENCFFKNVQNCVFVPSGFNSYEFSCLNCHAHADSLINNGFIIESTDSYLQNITMLNYKYPLTVKGGNTKIDNFHPWINVGIDNANSIFITMAPNTGSSASAYISNSTFDGYATIISLQNGYSFVQSINCNATYSSYTWNDTTKVPKLIDNTSDTYCTVRMIGCRLVNSTGSKTIDTTLTKVSLFTNNTSLNDINNFAQQYKVSASDNFNTDESTVTRNNIENGLNINVRATVINTKQGTLFKVCTVNIKLIPVTLSCLVVDGETTKVINCYASNYSIYICADSDMTINADSKIYISGNAYTK